MVLAVSFRADGFVAGGDDKEIEIFDYWDLSSPSSLGRIGTTNNKRKEHS